MNINFMNPGPSVTESRVHKISLNFIHSIKVIGAVGGGGGGGEETPPSPFIS